MEHARADADQGTGGVVNDPHCSAWVTGRQVGQAGDASPTPAESLITKPGLIHLQN